MKSSNVKTIKNPQMDDTQSLGVVSNSVEDNDMIQVDTLREYYMINEDQIEQLKRQQTADFQFKSPDELEYSIKNPYMDDETLLAIEKVGTLSPTKIMQEIREANKDIDQYNDKINNFYENDLDTQVYMLKLQMKARMEDGLIQQRMEFKTILNQYLSFIDKLIKDKSNLSETLQFCQTENLQLRDQLHEIMIKYEETEGKLKQIFIVYQEQQEANKREVELKEKKIAQITEQLVLQEQGVKSIRQKCGNEYQDLVNQNKEILRQITILNSENDHLQTENTSLNEKIQQFQQELNSLKQNNQAIAQKNTQFEEIDKQFNHFIIQIADSFSKTKKIVEEFQITSNEINNEVYDRNNLKLNDQLSEQQQLVVKQIITVNEKLERILQNNRNLILQNTSLIKINRELEITLEDKEGMFKKQIDEQSKSQQNSIINLQSELINSQQSLQKLQEQFDIHTKQTNIVQQLNNQLQKEGASLKDQIQQLEKEKQEACDKVSQFIILVSLLNKILKIQKQVEQKERLIVELENSILKLKDQIHKNLLTIDEIFSSFKSKENVHHSDMIDKQSEIKYLKEIISKYEEEIQKFQFQNEQIQLQQINLLRSYILNHEQAKSSKDFIDYIQSQIQNKYGESQMYEQSNVKRSFSPYLTETVLVQKDSNNQTPIRYYNKSQMDSMKSTQIIGQQENTFPSNILMQKKQSFENSEEILDIKKLKFSEKSGSQFSIPEIESQRIFKTDQKNSSQSLNFENSRKSSSSMIKDENINQMSQVINNLKMLSDQKLH